jgi:hypothetical protein
MKDTISSNTLFHFTRKLSYLKSILTEGFLPSYCLENFDTFKFMAEDAQAQSFEMAVPMVCFCDIPLSKVKSHMNQYGYYGIGLKKDWGIMSGIAPLVYASKESATTNSIESVLKYFLFHPAIGKDLGMSQHFNNLVRLVRFTKPYQGRFFRKGKYLNNITFYNEREWRYVPNIDASVGRDRPLKLDWLELAIPNILSTIKDPKERLDLAQDFDLLLRFPIQSWIKAKTFSILLENTDGNNNKLIHKFNQMLRLNYPLPFALENISYILVRSESEIRPLLQILRKSKVYPETEIEILASKILTKQQIFDDF